ncbi:MAG: tetratricopeptide repeat protein [Planctomycetaceae bacterium]
MDSAPIIPDAPQSKTPLPSVTLPTVPAPKQYVRAVTPGLRKLLYVVFGLLALLGANSLYLVAITALEAIKHQTYQNYFYQLMFLGHLVLGLLLIGPFVVFGTLHMLFAKNRRNRRAVKVGYALFAVSIMVLVSGLLLMRISGFELKLPLARSTVYWLHVITPILAGWLYWLHRLSGPRIKWKIGLSYFAVVGAAVVAMVLMHSQDPRKWNVVGPKEGEKYFEPSLARTASGNFIPAQTLMMDDYCQKCHPDSHAQWAESSHRFSSFSNPAYLASIRETREVSLKRDGNVQASRWCAGCHDPVPFFSGAFDDPKFDLQKHPTAHAGITCTTCHAITNVNSTRGNADFTIEEPTHYPFAFSDNAALLWINQQLVKAKPSFHKKTFLKDLHKTAEFCSTCHKVHLPYALNHYKDFLRGQNHFDSYWLSGAGHGARSFYFPPKAISNCAGCHMPLKESNDFGAKLFADAKKLSIHNHLFPAANTGLAWLRDAKPEVIEAHQKFLKEITRVDIFGVKEGGTIDGHLHAPIRPSVPTLKRGEKYLLETVVRTLKIGHHLTQGTVDSNEVWVEVTLTSGGQVIGKSGGLDADREVDPYSHFINVFMLDKEGNRIDRRNPQDIFTPLYNHQVPPGAGQVVHFEFAVPSEITAPITAEIKLQYRKFDKQYLDFVTRTAKPGDKPIKSHTLDEKYLNDTPITTMAADSVTFPVEGLSTETAAKVTEQKRDIPPWQRWNDYGIGLFLEGKAELRQSIAAFEEVEKLGRYDGPLNLARVLHREGRLDEAVEALNRAAQHGKQADDEPAPRWTLNWLIGMVNREQGRLKEAESSLRSVLDDRVPERNFDFSGDYEVINLLGLTLFEQAKGVRADGDPERERLLREAAKTFEKTLNIDKENVAAHYNLHQIYEELGDQKRAAFHNAEHLKVKQDDNAQGRAVGLARQKYPAANLAAEAIVIYPLQRDGAPGLKAANVQQPPAPVTTSGEE